jgi:uncharacterized protein YbaR (Trm112 family)
MISDELLPLLRCPQTMQALSVASPEQLAQIEAARVAGKLACQPVDAGLVRADGALLFPIRDGIPILLLDEALPLGVA